MSLKGFYGFPCLSKWSISSFKAILLLFYFTLTFDMDQDFLVSVLDVHKDNLQTFWPSLVCSIQNSSFIALDCVSVPLVLIKNNPVNLLIIFNRNLVVWEVES